MYRPNKCSNTHSILANRNRASRSRTGAPRLVVVLCPKSLMSNPPTGKHEQEEARTVVTFEAPIDCTPFLRVHRSQIHHPGSWWDILTEVKSGAQLIESLTAAWYSGATVRTTCSKMP